MIIRIVKILTAVILFLWCLPLAAQTNNFQTLSNSRARAFAMGGAVIGVEDDISALFYNPAGFNLKTERANTSLSVFFNPILPVVDYRKPEYDDIGGSNKRSSKVLSALKYFPKAISISSRAVDIGFVFNEELFVQKTDGKIFSAENVENNLMHSVGASLKVSSQVSVGISGSYIQADSAGIEKSGISMSYGLILKPNPIYQIGITFFDFSESIKDVRRRYERLADESLNIGLALFPWEGVLASIDVRNLTEGDTEDRFSLQEFHFGFEFSRIKHLMFRAGFYREDFTKRDNPEQFNIDPEMFSPNNHSYVYSAGIGLVDMNKFKSIGRRFNHKLPLISYTLIYKKTPLENIKWHFLTLSIQVD